jgi:hypothetical protein
MGMKILNNSGAYTYPGYTFTYDNGKKDPTNEGGDPKDTFGYGEEPYLFFAFLNGMTQKGMKEHGATRWCCGERVDVKKGKDFEPDNDSSGEEHPLKLQDLLDHGLTVFPAISGKFAEIDDDLGLSMTVTLMERDWTALITPEKKASALAATFKVGGAVAGAIGGCVGSGGFGCLLSVGAAMKTVIESLFGFLQTPPPPIEIEDPDDYMGTDVWAITRAEAKFRTVDDGAYAFWFDTPTPYFKSCLGWQPCPAGAGVPTTMRAKLYFCLYREGIPESQIKKACTPFEQVLPWPMAAK